MVLTVHDIAGMMDLSCVKSDSNETDVKQLVKNAKKFNCGQVSLLHCFIPDAKALLNDRPDIRVVGNVSFPSGSDSTTLKVAQAKEMLALGCDEIDMVISLGKLRSGRHSEVEKDVRAVVETADRIPVKVILEVSLLQKYEIEKVCEIAIRSGAAFVKTSTGWVPKGTTLEDIRQLKSIVGDRIKIKASGGIRGMETLIGMYKLGAVRFGVNMKSGCSILEECIAAGGQVEL